MFKRIILALCFVTISSCIATKNDLNVLKDEIEAHNNAKRTILKENITANIRKDILQLNARLKKIEDRLAINKKAQETKINLSFSTLDELKSTIMEINNRIDLVDVNSQKGSTTVINDIKLLTERVTALEEQNSELKQKLEKQIEDTTPVENVTITKEGRIRLPEDSEKSYKQIVKITKSGTDGKSVRKLWDAYSKKFKKSHRCDVVYWKAESYYKEKSYNNAITQFRRIEKEFKGCAKQEASYLRIAYSLSYISKNKLAGKVLKAMKMLYPKSSFKTQVRALEKRLKSRKKGKKIK